jgi:beta-1,4-mannosyl-glycoprotein beta-1,4-N-acetylglucosaminyltransferase
MIITAQPFLNELDLLEMKFEELAGVVDLHVVVESPMTFSGKPKPLIFKENAARFLRWPVKHVVCNLPRHVTPWERDDAVHKVIAGIVRTINPDVTMWVDADELPRRDTVERFLTMGVPYASIDMDFLLFFFDRIDEKSHHPPSGVLNRWRHPKISRRGVSRPDRYAPCHDVVLNAGWHFEFCGSRDELLTKIDSTAHAPEPGARNFHAKVTAGCLDGIERTTPYPLEMLPAVVQADPQRFRRFFCGL